MVFGINILRVTMNSIISIKKNRLYE